MHIAVGIITLERPEWLKRLLRALQSQRTEDLFGYSIVVVDNDRAQSAFAIVKEMQADGWIPIEYCVEPERNLALARNAAIRHSRGEYLAFIDDDEEPVEEWLWHLYRTCLDYEAAGVLGPVVPRFEHTPPRWIIKSGVFDRPRYRTGRVLKWDETRTGNVLLRRDILRSEADWFRADFATHGEDRDFFKRLIANGNTFVWCDEAVAFETQPPARQRRRYHIRRALVRGSVAYTHSTSKLPSLLKSMVAAIAYTLSLPFLQLMGHHHFMKYLIKDCDHLGKLLASWGWRMDKRIKQL